MFSQIADIFQQKTICESAEEKEGNALDSGLKTPSVWAKFGLKWVWNRKFVIIENKFRGGFTPHDPLEDTESLPWLCRPSFHTFKRSDRWL